MDVLGALKSMIGMEEEPEREGLAPDRVMDAPLERARPTGGYSESNLPEGMSKQQWRRLGMYKRKALRETYFDDAGQEQGTLVDAREREKRGEMTLDDALALGLMPSRYGDFGTTEDRVDNTRMVSGRRGRYGMTEESRPRTRALTAQDVLGDMNKVRRNQYALGEQLGTARDVETMKAESAMGAAKAKGQAAITAAGLKSGRLVPDGKGGFAQAPPKVDRTGTVKTLPDGREILYTTDKSTQLLPGKNGAGKKMNVAERQKLRDKEFGKTQYEAGRNADTYYAATYDENGNMKQGATADPQIEQYLSFLNDVYEESGDKPPFLIVERFSADDAKRITPEMRADALKKAKGNKAVATRILKTQLRKGK